MRWIFRVLGILLCSVLLLVVATWAVVVFTDVPARALSSGFNDSNGGLWLETRGARLHPDLMGFRVQGASLSERAKKDPLVQFERLDAELGALPSDELISLDHVDLEGLRVELDAERLPALRALSGPSEPSTPGKPGGLLRLGRLRVTDAALTWHDPVHPAAVTGLDLELKGVLGATGDLSLSGAAKTLTVGTWSVEGLRLDDLALTWSGLQGALRLGGLSAGRLAGPGLELTDARVGLEAAGGIAGAQVTRLTLTSPRLSATLTGHARPSIGFTSQGLEVVVEATFEASPAELLPTTCTGISRATGRFRLAGDVTRGPLRLESLEVTATGPAGPRTLSRANVPLAGVTGPGPLAAALCAEAGTAAP